VKKSSFTRVFAAAAAVLLPLLAASAPAQAENERYVYITHGPDSDSWFNTIKNAIKNAEKDLGVTVEYRNPPSGDIADMARIIQQATATTPNGIITTIADFDVLQPAITAAIDRGIPVMTVNSGTGEQSRELGALMHIGQPGIRRGQGRRRAGQGSGCHQVPVREPLHHQPRFVERCQGYADALGVELGNQMIDTGIDPTNVYNKVKSYLTQNPTLRGILTLGPQLRRPDDQAAARSGRNDKYNFISFDLSADIAQGVKDGIVDAAIDQQPYLQGYLPVSLLTQYVVTASFRPATSIRGRGFVTTRTSSWSKSSPRVSLT
jgi:simple sugar transport system substrate-binding protein